DISSESANPTLCRDQESPTGTEFIESPLIFSGSVVARSALLLLICFSDFFCSSTCPNEDLRQSTSSPSGFRGADTGGVKRAAVAGVSSAEVINCGADPVSLRPADI